ncbi:hypothetical protein NQ317_007142 [Molorchus minor]|uniref:Uncharacterized protein n=1 Tax=Molorchus minor TaxID=1323400 RepID=A0ABQ9JYD7_9CUCU|nr:hypothetical protein NQ317_007142 [Molorchus minor]
MRTRTNVGTPTDATLEQGVPIPVRSQGLSSRTGQYSTTFGVASKGNGNISIQVLQMPCGCSILSSVRLSG